MKKKTYSLKIFHGVAAGYRIAFPIRRFPKTGIMPGRGIDILFDTLAAFPQGWFADLFCGSGIVACEARSRGYRPVVLNELDRKKIPLLRRITKDMADRFPFSGQDFVFSSMDAVRIFGNWNAYSRRMGLRYSPGVIFCDPPFIRDQKHGHNRVYWKKINDMLQNRLLPALRGSAYPVTLALRLPISIHRLIQEAANKAGIELYAGCKVLEKPLSRQRFLIISPLDR